MRDLPDRSGVTAAIGEEHIHSWVLEGVLMHLAATAEDAEAFLGQSGGVLSLLQQVVNDMLSQAEGNRRAQLAAFAARLSWAINQTARG